MQIEICWQLLFRERVKIFEWKNWGVLTENDIVEDIEEEADQQGGSEINRALIEKIIATEKKIEKLQRDKEFLGIRTSERQKTTISWYVNDVHKE